MLACACVLLGAVTSWIVSAPVARAATGFSPRQTFNVNGAIALIGNTNLSCGTSASCTTAQAANSGGTEVDNNSFAMTNLDLDTVSSTFNSSNSQLILPAGSSVLWAGLYWGARLSAGASGSDAPTSPGRSQMLLRGPSDAAYRAVNATFDFGGPDNSSVGAGAYQEFADVTGIVQAEGVGTWWGANIAAATGKDRYAGWTLVIAYRNPTLPLRNLSVFDGFNTVSTGNPQTITISGFLAPLAGPVQTQLGMVAYEGDLGITGDSATLSSGGKTTTLATGLSPGNNFFSSANSLNGVNVTTRNPSYRNMQGFDVKNFGAPNTIPNGATSATITLGTSGDTYFPGVVSTAIDLFAPDFTSSSKTVTYVAGNSPAGPGDTLQYTVNIVNTGSDPANGSVLTDVLPPNTTFVPGSLAVVNGPNTGPKTDAGGDDQAEFVAATRTVRFRLGTGANATAGGTIGVNVATAVIFEVTVDPAAANTTVSNQATLAYVAATLNQPFTYVTNAASTPVVANADLSVTKTSTVAVNAGQVSASTITVHNGGPNDAVNAQVSDTLPSGVVFVSAAPSSGTCSQAGGTVSCSLGDLANGSNATITVQVRVPANSTNSSITDVASATSDTNDPNLQNNTAGATTTVGTSADLVVTKTATPATVAPGGTITFPVTVHNNGPSDAQSVTLGDAFASSLTVVSVDRTDVCQTATAGFSCVLPTLAAGDSFTVTLVAQVPPDFTGASVSNTATAASQTPDPVPGNNSDTAAVAVTGPVADVAITKAADQATVVAGTQVTYTLTVSNPAGPSVATGVVVTDPLPSGLAAASAVSDLGTCQLGPPVTCTLGTLFVGATATITIVANVSPDATLQPVTNTASVTTTSLDPDTANNSASAVTSITGAADLALNKTGTGTPVAGGPIAYTLTAGNNGPSRARGVTITDTLPASLTGITAPGCSIAGQTVTCTIADIAVNDSAVFTINATVVSAFPGGNITNTATVTTTGTTDPNPGNNSATFTSTAGTAADLSLSKTAPATANAGDTIAYGLTVGNAGPSAAAAATVTDPLPAGLTAVSATTDQGSCVLGPPVTCSLGTMTAAATVHITITARIDPSASGGTIVTNTATVGSTTLDPTASNNSDTASTTVTTSADVSVTKTLLTSTTPPLAPGQQLQFQIQVHNNGPSDASSISLRDALSVNATTTDLTIGGTPALDTCTLSSGDLVCPVGNLPAGGTATIVMTVTTDPGAALATYTNAATASALTPDPVPANNAAQVSFDLARTQADLAISKTGDAQLVAGAPFSYTITVDNTAGPSNAAGVVVTDTLPAGLTATQALPTQGSCTIAASTITCNLGTVLASTTPVITLNGTVNSSAPSSSVTNTATVTSTTADPDTTNNTASFDSTITTQADLTLTKTPDSDPLVAGTTVGYTLTVTNGGPSDANPVTLIDVLPAAVAFDPTSSDPTCTQAVTVNCALGSIPAGTTRVVRVSGQLDPSFAGATLTNTATVSSPVDDPNPDDNTATVTSNVTQQADLSVTKLADATTPAAGSNITYAISVVNNGPSDAVNASFTDVLPFPLTSFELPSQGDVTCALIGADTVHCTVPRLPAGQSRTGQITVHIPADHASGAVANTASVASDTPDPNPTNNTATATVSVVLSADLTLTKTIVTNPIVAGAPVTFQLTLVNHGPSIAPNALISDPLSTDVTFTSASAGCTPNPGEENLIIVACGLGTLGVGDSASATITVTPHPGATGTLSNTASAGANALDPAPEDNTATATGPITAQADLAVTITGPSIVAAGGSAVFHIDYSNLGPSNATTVVVTDTLPTGLTPQIPSGCTLAGQVLTCNVGSLGAGASGTITLTVNVDPATAAGTVLLQTATVAADQNDTNPANNTSTVSSTVTRATDVGVTVTAAVPTVMPGGVASYTVTITNHGPLTATAVALHNVLPPQVTNPSDPPSCTFTGNTATCALGTMAVGATVTIPFRGDVPSTTPVGTKLTDTATVTRSETDTVPANDSDNATITVVAASPTPAPPTPPPSTNVAPPAPPAGPPPSGLATTGENTVNPLEAALLLIVLGTGLALVGLPPKPETRRSPRKHAPKPSTDA